MWVHIFPLGHNTQVTRATLVVYDMLGSRAEVRGLQRSRFREEELTNKRTEDRRPTRCFAFPDYPKERPTDVRTVEEKTETPESPLEDPSTE